MTFFLIPRSIGGMFEASTDNVTRERTFGRFNIAMTSFSINRSDEVGVEYQRARSSNDSPHGDYAESLAARLRNERTYTRRHRIELSYGDRRVRIPLYLSF